ncbi:enoyl-CoA hydratase EchA19-like [Lineus longissimus]|uniref:enoyl-CoA hydratase EchA19-like n=1 Tax=Lineus longissimus TaxID=88925 RepID=UPI00315DCF77
MAASLQTKIFPNCFQNVQKYIFSAAKRFAHSIDKPLVVKEQIGKVCLIAINRPEKRNAVDKATAKELVTTLKAFENDDSMHVAVLHGKGGNFCAGYDLQNPEDTLSNLKESTNYGQYGPMGSPKLLVDKPIIAAIEGYAVAGGLELSLLCDMRVADETAVMGVFSRRFGVPLIDGGTVRLPKLIGYARAMDLILTGRAVSAKEAMEFGLVNKMVSTGTALGCAIQLAHSIAEFPQECLRADRRSAHYATFDAESLSDALRYEFENGKDVIARESIQGAKKFLEGAGRHGSFKNPATYRTNKNEPSSS